ncbi:hypothetical protein [Tabrizicola sp. YIM 78059]|uniref:hypothetical protein n=1 Tax=Tabrizicola sp. YIM 78059 TaxID=2529861 RepID=UPI00145BD818|nr:hypothetical protein [Tabrizicola sp. YIM 78059]
MATGLGWQGSPAAMASPSSPSGSGESALLHLIAGLEEVMAGEIAIAGQVVNHLEPRERGCAMVFHGHALIHTWRWGKTSAMR